MNNNIKYNNKMYDINKEKYVYSSTKKYLLDLLNCFEKMSNDKIKELPDKLEYLIKASSDLGISFIYLLIILKNKDSEKNLSSFLISLYYEDIETRRLEQLFNNITSAYDFVGAANNNNIAEFLQNIEIFGILDNYKNEVRTNLSKIEIIYSKITSTIDIYNTYIEVGEASEEDAREIKLKYDECLKEINDLKINRNIPNLKFNLDFFNDLLSSVDINKLDNKNKEIKYFGIDENDYNFSNNINNNLSFSSSKIISQRLEKIPLKNRKFFILNELLNYGEDVETEFKNYMFFTNINEIIPLHLAQKLQRLFCGFLNNKGGRIYFGINDQKYVKGNKLNYEQRDKLSLELINLTNGFYPECKTSKISVHFIPIKGSNQAFLKDRYVTKVIIKQGDTDKLYSVSNKVYESYKRVQCMVSNLKPEVIANEIYKRKANPEMPIPEDQFKDPEPEENLYESDDIYGENYKKRKRNKKYYKNELIAIKVKNINEETPVFLLDEVFNEDNNIIENKKFFENNGISLGYGYIYVRDKNSAYSIIDKYDNMNIYGKKIRLHIDKKRNY